MPARLEVDGSRGGSGDRCFLFRDDAAVVDEEGGHSLGGCLEGVGTIGWSMEVALKHGSEGLGCNARWEANGGLSFYVSGGEAFKIWKPGPVAGEG